MATTMKAVRIHAYGGSEELVYEDAPRPAPGPNEVLVRVRAASVNPMDWKMRAGYARAWIDPPLPIILGRDFAGDITAVGADVTGWDVGDAVFGQVNLDRGSHAEYVVVPATDIARMPQGLDYETAAAVPLAAQAAWVALVETGELEAGQTVLIHGAAGGVGSFAVQIARLRGARVIATASAANHELVRSLGADEVIDYRTTRFEDVVQDVALVLDTVGGEVQERSWAVLRPGGMLVSLPYPPSQEAAAAHGVRAAMAAVYPDATRLQTIAELIVTGQLRPVISTVLPLAEARQAHEMSEAGHTRGKIVLQIPDASVI